MPWPFKRSRSTSFHIYIYKCLYVTKEIIYMHLLVQYSCLPIKTEQRRHYYDRIAELSLSHSHGGLQYSHLPRVLEAKTQFWFPQATSAFLFIFTRYHVVLYQSQNSKPLSSFQSFDGFYVLFYTFYDKLMSFWRKSNAVSKFLCFSVTLQVQREGGRTREWSLQIMWRNQEAVMKQQDSGRTTTPLIEAADGKLFPLACLQIDWLYTME